MESVYILCNAGADITRFPHLLLHLAAREENVEMLKCLVEILESEKIDMTAFPPNPSALLELANKNNAEGIKILLKAGLKSTDCYASPYSNYGFNLLHFLAENNNVDLLQQLVKESLIDIKALINQKAENGETPLSIARNEKNIEFEKFLLELGAEDANILSIRPDYTGFEFHSATIVVGNHQGEKVVILGKKPSQRNNGKIMGLFPGGLKDITDQNLTETGIREFEEETDFPLKDVMHKHNIFSKIIFNYEDDNKETLCKHAFVFIDLQDHLDITPLRENDDLLYAEAIPLSEIKIDGNNVSHNDIPILRSNGFILEAIISNNKKHQELHILSEDQKNELFFLMQIEKFPNFLAQQAVLKNDINQLERLQKNNISLSNVYYSNNEKRDDYILFYICTDFSEKDKQCRFEIKEKKWFEKAELPSDISPATLRRIKEYFKELEKSDTW